MIEARSKGELYGEQRLSEHLAELGSMPAEGLPQALFGDVEKFCGGKFVDNIAIICVALE